jgi:hypothetical protein
MCPSFFASFTLTQNVQGCLLPRCACAASPRFLGAARPFLFCPATGFCLAHVTPIMADRKEEKTMTILNLEAIS